MHFSMRITIRIICILIPIGKDWGQNRINYIAQLEQIYLNSIIVINSTLSNILRKRYVQSLAGLSFKNHKQRTLHSATHYIINFIKNVNVVGCQASAALVFLRTYIRQFVYNLVSRYPLGKTGARIECIGIWRKVW